MPTCFTVCNDCGVFYPNMDLFKCNKCGSSNVDVDREMMPRVYDDIDDIDDEEIELEEEDEGEYE